MPPTDFRLHAEEPLADGLRRVLTGQLDHALALLRDEADLGEAVHEVRKALKRCRAVLRLVRHVIGEEAYQRENTALRDAARPWGRVRDSAVLVETAQELAEDTGGAGDGADPVVARLREEARGVSAAARRDRAGARGTISVLEGARSRVAGLTQGPRWAEASPGPGLQRVLDRARRHGKKARKDPSTERLHRWRKEVKYLGYQAQLLAGRAEEDGEVEYLARRLSRLGSRLGDDHDLAVLAEALEEDAGLAGTTAAGWVEEVERRRRKIQRKALPRGKKVLRRAGALTEIR